MGLTYKLINPINIMENEIYLAGGPLSLLGNYISKYFNLPSDVVLSGLKENDFNWYLFPKGFKSDDGKYEIVEGLFGQKMNRLSQVYLAQDNSGEKYIAKVNIPNSMINVLNLKSSGMDTILKNSVSEKRTEHEANILQLINKKPHDGIVKLIDRVSFKYFDTLVLERIEQTESFEPMDELQTGPFDGRQNSISWDWFKHNDIQTLESAIFHLISNGIVHRDVKPDNMILSKGEDGGRISTLIDFGESNLVDEPKLDLINRAYSAPEYLYGVQHPYSDLYSLGLIMYESLLNRTYFGQILANETISDLLRKHRKSLKSGMDIDSVRKKTLDKFPYQGDKMIEIFENNNASLFNGRSNSSGVSCSPYLDRELKNYIRRSEIYLNFDPDKRMPPKHLFEGSLVDGI